MASFYGASKIGPTTLGRLLWTSDRPLQTPLPANTQRSKEKNIHASGSIRTRNSSKREFVDSLLSPRGHRERHWGFLDVATSVVDQPLELEKARNIS
jgi:hypothetical protein